MSSISISFYTYGAFPGSATEAVIAKIVPSFRRSENQVAFLSIQWNIYLMAGIPKYRFPIGSPFPNRTLVEFGGRLIEQVEIVCPPPPNAALPIFHLWEKALGWQEGQQTCRQQLGGDNRPTS